MFTWQPRTDIVPEVLLGYVERALAGSRSAAMRLYCAECRGFEGYTARAEAGTCPACCMLYGYRLGPYEPPGPRGWISPGCVTCNDEDCRPAKPEERAPALLERLADGRAAFTGVRTVEPGDHPATVGAVIEPLSSRAQVVARFCLTCQGSSRGRTTCPSVGCWLWPFRTGTADASQFRRAS